MVIRVEGDDEQRNALIVAISGRVENSTPRDESSSDNISDISTFDSFK